MREKKIAKSTVSSDMRTFFTRMRKNSQTSSSGDDAWYPQKALLTRLDSILKKRLYAVEAEVSLLLEEVCLPLVILGRKWIVLRKIGYL